MTDKKELIDESLNPDDCTYCGRCAKFAKHIENKGDSGDLYVVTSYQNFKKFFTEHVDTPTSYREDLYNYDTDEIVEVPLSKKDFYMLCRLLMLADKDDTVASSISAVVESLLKVPTTIDLNDTGCLGCMEICFSRKEPYWAYRVRFEYLKTYFAEFLTDAETTLFEPGYFSSIFGESESRDKTLDKMYTSIRFGLDNMISSQKLDLRGFIGEITDYDFNCDDLTHLSDFLTIAEICVHTFQEARRGGKEFQKRRLEQIKQSWKQFDSTADKRETENKNA